MHRQSSSEAHRLEGTDTTSETGGVERRFLGMVEVDSGTLLVGDPLYCLPDGARDGAGIDYAAVIDGA